MALKKTNHMPSEQKKTFRCNTCGKVQNIDQSVHIQMNYCVSCYNKEQIYRDVKKKMDNYIIALQNNHQYTKTRKQKLKDLTLLNEILLPSTIFELEDGEVLDRLHDAQRNAFKKGMSSLREKYHLRINEDAVTMDLVNKMASLWHYKRIPSPGKLNELSTYLEPFIEPVIQDKKSFFADLKQAVVIPAFTQLAEKLTSTQKFPQKVITERPILPPFTIIPVSPFLFTDKAIIQVVKAYRKKISKVSTQAEQFRFFLQRVGEFCQFQTAEDRLKDGIEQYVLEYGGTDLHKFSNRVMQQINQMEDAPLIPNIAKYIMDNYEYIFETWYTDILTFDRSRFMVSQAKTGSRTDFVVRLQYRFRSYEIKMIADALRNTTEILLKNKADQRIVKILKDDNLTSEEKNTQITSVKTKLEKDLQPDQLAQIRQQNANGAPMVARLLLLNTEKAFNLVLTEVIQYHYKRLRIDTTVQYITNVLESGAVENRGDLKAYYLIQSREW